MRLNPIEVFTFSLYICCTSNIIVVLYVGITLSTISACTISTFLLVVSFPFNTTPCLFVVLLSFVTTSLTFISLFKTKSILSRLIPLFINVFSNSKRISSPVKVNIFSFGSVIIYLSLLLTFPVFLSLYLSHK